MISPFYTEDDFVGGKLAQRWRDVMAEIVSAENYSNVYYIDGLDLLGEIKYNAAYFVHPNIYGVQKIADDLLEYISKTL